MPVDFEIVPDLAFDYSVIARTMAEHRRKNKKTVPDVARLTTSITGVELEDTIYGSSTLRVTISDPDMELAEFVDVDDDGRLERINLNYPSGSQHWWRLSQLGMANQVGSIEMTLTFMERPTVYLQHMFGPVKANRANVTRAEFFNRLIKRTNQRLRKQKLGAIRLVSRELHQKQAVIGGPQRDESEGGGARLDRKEQGIPLDANLKVQGSKATTGQIRQMNRVLNEVQRMGGAPALAVDAILVAALGESGFRTDNISYAGARGVFQLMPFWWDQIHWSDTEGQVRHFMNKGFYNGRFGNKGAIEIAKKHPGVSPGDIATNVEGSGEAGSFYDKFQGEANEILRAYGGVEGTGGSTTTYYKADYFFQIGDEEDPHESYWDGMTRLANDVNWRLFCDGRTIFYDDEMRLIRQMPVTTIRRNHPSVISFDALWDARKIATEMTLELICDPFDFRAGQVFELDGFGPLSRGSTAKPKPLPGRWLIAGITRSSGQLSSRFTLKQPERPKREPAHDIVEREGDEHPVGGSVEDIEAGSTPKEIIDHIVLPLARKNGIRRSVAENDAANRAHGPTVSGSTSDHQGPPSKRWAADMSNGGSPTSGMDKLAKDLIRTFDLPDLASWRATGGYIAGNAVSATHKGRRFQLIYRTTLGGDHYNHVHFGVEDNRTAAQIAAAKNQEDKGFRRIPQDNLSSRYGWGQM